MTAFDRANDVLFVNRDRAEDVAYTPMEGPPIDRLRAIFDIPDKESNFGGSGFVGGQPTARIRIADVPMAARGDRIERSDGSAFQVEQYRADGQRLNHILTLSQLDA